MVVGDKKMVSSLKVRVFKKSKDASVPEHIIVKRPATHEQVHMHFYEGALVKFTHFIPNPQIKTEWDGQEKKYKALSSPYIIFQQFSVKDGELTCSKWPENQDFSAYSDCPMFNLRQIGFQPSVGSPALFIEMDLQFKCRPNKYIRDCSMAEIQEIYTRQPIATQPNVEPIKNQEPKQNNHQLKTTWKDILLGMFILPVVVYDMVKRSFPSEEHPFKPDKVVSHNKHQTTDSYQNQR